MKYEHLFIILYYLLRSFAITDLFIRVYTREFDTPARNVNILEYQRKRQNKLMMISHHFATILKNV